MAADVKEQRAPVGNYKGFVAGIFSGIAKLTGKLSVFLSSLHVLTSSSRAPIRHH